MTNVTETISSSLQDLFEQYQRLPHQNDAISLLEQVLVSANSEALDYSQPWYKYWSAPLFNNTWETAYETSAALGVKYPEVAAAQWALHSNYGKRLTGTHNYFELVDDKTNEALNFSSAWECFKYIITRLYTNPEGANVNQGASSHDCARLLGEASYNDDPEYATKISRIIIAESPYPELRNGILSGRNIRVLVDVPYNYTDRSIETDSRLKYRENLSHVCAMVAGWHDQVSSVSEYRTLAAQNQSSIIPWQHVLTFRALGFQSQYTNDGTGEILEREIDAGNPVIVEWKNNNSIEGPSGSHPSCCVGYFNDDYIFIDPNGQADLINGGYLQTTAKSGHRVSYNKETWLRRWGGQAILVQQVPTTTED